MCRQRMYELLSNKVIRTLRQTDYFINVLILMELYCCYYVKQCIWIWILNEKYIIF